MIGYQQTRQQSYEALSRVAFSEVLQLDFLGVFSSHFGS